MTIIDAKGKACPLPVIEAKQALEHTKDGDTVHVLVDNEIAVQNLTKMAQQKKFSASHGRTEDGNYYVDIVKSEIQQEEQTVCVPTNTGKTVVVLSSDVMGGGSDELGRALMKGFVFALTQIDSVPDTVLLFNGGAKLSSEVPETIADLKKLEQAGAEILTCGTCLNFYGLTDKLAVGSVTNMYVICETMSQAGRIIRP